MKEEKQWYVVYTRPRSEKKVTAALLKKKIEVYCPVKRVEQQWALAKRTISEPLFSCHVFVYCNESEFVAVKQTEGVVNFAYWRGALAVINPQELDVIKDYMVDNYKVSIEKIPVSNDDIINVAKGPVIQSEGTGLVVRERSVRISLPSLGYALIAVPKMNIDVMKTARGFRFIIKD